MPLYEYRCQKCREVFGVERSMTDESAASCSSCGSEEVSRIWNAVIRTGAGRSGSQSSTPDKSTDGGMGGGGSCHSHNTGCCH